MVNETRQRQSYYVANCCGERRRNKPSGVVGDGSEMLGSGGLKSRLRIPVAPCRA